MDTKKNYGALDAFKMIAAFLVVAIHTSPLAAYSASADFFLTRILARLAVPFFFMVTGQFILSDVLTGKSKDFTPVRRYLKKILMLYGAAALAYLPVGIYAGHYKDLDLLSLLRMLFFDGTFYHLWYFPALILGICCTCLLARFCSLRLCAILSLLLFLLGLLGDSYWGAIRTLPVISSVYELGFCISSYTRNGLFFAPLFLLMGARIKKCPSDTSKFALRTCYLTRKFRGISYSIKKCPSDTCRFADQTCNKPEGFPIDKGQADKVLLKNGIGFAAALLLMSGEGFVLRKYTWQRHDSMYLMLPACMYFLYSLLLSCNKKSTKPARTISTYIYLVHPLMIIAVRGIAKILHATGLMVDNTALHYLLVCLFSIAASLACMVLLSFLKRKPYDKARAWIELDREALTANCLLLSSLLPKDCVLMPALKANAYGHGAIPMAKMLNGMGIHAFCVACVKEGIALRKNGIRGEILILGYTHPKDFFLLRRYRLTQTVVDYSYARMLNRYGKPLRVHVGIDTGMHRLGERSENLEHLCRIFEMKNLKIEGAFTHLCTDDTNSPADVKFTRRQASAFFDVIDELCRQGYSCPKLHLLSSYGVLNYPELKSDYARVGIALYGVKSADADYNGSDAHLRPVLSLHTRIASIRSLLPGENAGYGLSFTAQRPTKIATLAIGYADGLPRSLSLGRGSVLIHGKRAPILGRICMDQTMVDITDIPNAHAGDIATLIGAQENESISVYEVAHAAQTITNEILSGLSQRLSRIVI